MAKNGPWSCRECYFAVWAYDRLDQDHEICKKDVYREVARIIGRSEKAVEYKVQNVSAIDPRPMGDKPISEAPHYQLLLKRVYTEYMNNREEARRTINAVLDEGEEGEAALRQVICAGQ